MENSNLGSKLNNDKLIMGSKNKNQEEKLHRCREWLLTLDSLSPEEQEETFFEFVDCYQPSEDEEDFGDAAHAKIKKQIRSKKFVDETLELKCGWKDCIFTENKYNEFQSHVRKHINDIRTIDDELGEESYNCLWNACGGCGPYNYKNIIKHINLHCYHTKLKSVGINVLKRYALPECRKNSHQKNTLPEPMSAYICQWIDCGMEFFDIQEFVDHVKCHILGADVTSDKRLRCGWLGCGKNFPNMNKIKMHSRLHTNEKTVACPNCGTMFATNCVFEDHCTRQASKLPDYRCDTCCKSFSTERLLRSHARRHINSYKCAFCDMTCPAPSALIRHMRYRHLNYKPFKCNRCNYRGVDKCDVKQHALKHQSPKRKDSEDENESVDVLSTDPLTVKIYSCHCCVECFKSGGRLTQHLIKVHGYSRASGFQRFRYEQKEDGFYRLIPVRYESLEVSNQIMEEQQNKKVLPSTSKESDDGNYKLIECNKGDAENIASFILISPSMNDEVISDSINNQSTTQTDDKTTKRVNRTKNQKRKSTQSKSSPVKKIKLSQVELKLDREKMKNIKRPSEQSKTQSIQISIAEIDQHGNILRSEIMESQEIIG